eukprot:gb/GECG01003667.1/.p1 GENE.gb/GECG01003667.1/~~gb/GECG01003667.1/.p1  ORF type:complete len:117 (+),score=12.17 gb/GECG01003667.1/:1-351(+)
MLMSKNTLGFDMFAFRAVAYFGYQRMFGTVKPSFQCVRINQFLEDISLKFPEKSHFSEQTKVGLVDQIIWVIYPDSGSQPGSASASGPLAVVIMARSLITGFVDKLLPTWAKKYWS